MPLSDRDEFFSSPRIAESSVSRLSVSAISEINVEVEDRLGRDTREPSVPTIQYIAHGRTIGALRARLHACRV
jgi:hypothetical protein